MMLLLGFITGGLFGIGMMCLFQIGSNINVVSRNRLVDEIESSERSIQSISKFSDLGGTMSWWQGRKSLAQQLLSEVEGND